MNKSYGSKDNSNIESLKKLGRNTISMNVKIKGIEEVIKQFELVTNHVEKLNQKLSKVKMQIESVKSNGKT